MTSGRYYYVLRNYASITLVFVGFAVAVLFAAAFTSDEAVAYLVGVALVGAAWITSIGLKRDFANGFLPYCFGFLLCTAAFPATDIFAPAASQFLYAGFFGMMLMAVALMIRAGMHK